jgi:hypothetical protein
VIVSETRQAGYKGLVAAMENHKKNLTAEREEYRYGSPH